MEIRTIEDLSSGDFRGKRVLVRVDYNCPIADGKVTDDSRIQATIPTLDFLLGQGAKPILMSHLGRPKGKRVPEMSLEPVHRRLSEIAQEKWGAKVLFAQDCVGQEAKDAASELDGLEQGILLLENLRFHKAETENDDDFAKELAALGSLFVQEAFGTVHRAHASTEAITRILPAYAGYLVERELKTLGELLINPPRPFVAIIGGSKVSTKIEILETLGRKVNTMLIGGGMTYTFLKAKDIPVGGSIVEDEFQGQAFSMMTRHQNSGTEFILPVDHVITNEVSEKGKTKVVAQSAIPEDWSGVDIGPKTISLFEEKIKQAGTVFWNGPLGVFEIDKFAKGSEAIARAVAKTKAKTVVGGGDVISALHKFGLADKVTHVSTGGGASLEFLGGKKLPGVVPLEKE
jgi:phosphoglycerate kinase